MGNQYDYDKGYKEGYEIGKDDCWLGDIANSVSESLPSLSDPTYDKGFEDGRAAGVDDRPGFFDGLFGGSDDASDDTSSSGGCFITSACAEAMHLSDDCHELTTLRSFRDSFLMSRSDGRRAVDEYYQIAPRIVAAIKATPDPVTIFRGIFDRMVSPAVAMIKAGKGERAFHAYRVEVDALAKTFL